MLLAEALELVQAGASVTSDTLPLGTVLKLSEGWEPRPRVVFVATGSGFNFRSKPEHEHDRWQKVEGWLTYGAN